MRRAAAIAFAALAATPGGAAAQFRTRPMVIPSFHTSARILPQPFATPEGPPAADLLLVRSGGAPALLGRRALLAPLASPWAQPAFFPCAAAGRLAQNGGDALPDVAFCGRFSGIEIAFGDAPGVLQSYLPSFGGSSASVSFARLHPPPRETDVLLVPWSTGGGEPGVGRLYALDLGSGAVPAIAEERYWPADAISRRMVPAEEALTFRMSPTARALGIDDVYVAGFNSVTILAHEAPPAGSTLADVRFGPKVKVGGWSAEGVDPSLFLPPGVTIGDVLGAAPLDVDFDGLLDLVFPLSPSFHFCATPPCLVPAKLGRLLWAKGTGNVQDLPASIPWHDLTSHPDLQPLVDPSFGRPLEMGGAPAFAVFDRGSDSVLVISSDRAARRLRVWRGGAAGRHIRDFWLADVAGSIAPDLVADGTQLIDDYHPPADPAILVWPDLGDASPELAWAPGNPGAPERGEDHRLAVSARDPDGPFTVDWLVGDPYGTPAASSPGLAAGVAHEVAYLHGGALLCALPPQTLAVTVRATDGLGVFDEIAATLDVSPAARLAVLGAVPPDRLALPPGGTIATLEGSAWTRCGSELVFTWGGSIFAAAAGFVEEPGAASSRRIVDLPEASYPALLASQPDATLLVTDGAAALTSPLAVLPLALDAGDLVEVEHASDLPALAPGEVALLRTTIRSRLGVALPAVRLVDVLAGLAPAGPPRVAGAQVVSTAAGGAELVLDALPAGGAAVVVELPVSSTGARGASAVEVRSSGGHLLTPAAQAGVGEATAPGCGCGGPGAGAEALLALLALARRRRQPRNAAGGAGSRGS